MRDILNDLDHGRHHPSDLDPMRRAQKHMQTPRPKRFYTRVEVEGDGGTFRVLLDGRAVRTPAKAELLLPTERAAKLVAQEYEAQGEYIDPITMPVTRLGNTAIDGVASDPQAVAEDIMRYASSDLLCYRADSRERLIAREPENWEPVPEWAEGELGGRVMLAQGVMHVEDPRATIAAVGAYPRPRREPLRLATLHGMTTLT